MPQPLSNVNSTAPVLFHPKAMNERPQLAALAARAIAGWSEVEGQMGTLLVKLLGSNAEPALAMFSAVTSAPAQIATVRAAAETVLPPDANEMLQAVLLVAGNRSKLRHHLAHHVWGYSDALPDALILAESKHIAKYWMKIFENSDRFKRGEVPTEVDWPRSKLYVYKQNDFEQIISQMDELYDYFYQLGALIQPDFPWPGRIFDYLNSKPPIHEALLRIRKSAQS